MSALKDPRVRKYIYSVLIAVGAALVSYGVLTQEEVAVWLNVFAAALLTGGTVLARNNTPSDDDA